MGKALIAAGLLCFCTLLGWSQSDLAKKSGVSLPTIASLEQDEGELGGRDAPRKKLFAAFKRAGLSF